MCSSSMSEKNLVPFCFAIATLQCDSDLLISVRSILNQKLRNNHYQLVIVFGDQLEESKFVKQSLPELSHYDLPEIITGVSSVGIYAAFNACILNCTARYITFLGSGDTLASDGYELINQISVVNPQVDIISFALRVDGQSYYVPNFASLSSPPHQALAYNTNIIRNNSLFYDERLRVYGDSIFTNSFLRYASSMLVFKSYLLNYKSGGTGSSRNLNSTLRRINDLFRVFRFHKFSVYGFFGFLIHSILQFKNLFF